MSDEIPMSIVLAAAAKIADEVVQRLRDDPLKFTPWRDPDDAARYLSLTRRGMEDMRARGVGPKFHKVGRVVRYNITDLDRWLITGGSGPV